ncbi:hypothetical protein SAMN05216359_10415 [Roseateles sp. YR242]|uniref:hypothetical protein n=1 Tax=Roseateles sp. YR242 TaxID=1855305 RepID=UPI0008B0EE88|nr:hypothetical protein [Roseateles sp. YR242]SEK92954.1 hypothetical protein SAMN05216359_10415 [Roseateles sp. YR242]
MTPSMLSNITNAAPASGTPPRRDDEPARDAWQREMERAQANTWFHHESGEAADSTASRTGQPASAQASAAAQPASVRTQPQPPLPWSGMSATSLCPSVAAAAGPAAGSVVAPTEALARSEAQDGLAAAATPEQPRRSGDMLSRTSSTLATPATATSPDALAAEAQALAEGLGTPESPVRVHVQWKDKTAHVWVGIDARVTAPQAEVAGTVVRQLREQGLRVGRLICNGTELPVPDPDPVLSKPASRPGPDVVAHITTREF